MLQLAGSGGGDGGREVVFRLRLLPGTDDKRALKAVGDEAVKQQKRIDQSVVASAKAKVREQEKAEKSALQTIQREAKEREKATAKEQRDAEKLSQWRTRLRFKSFEDEQKGLQKSAKAQEKASADELRLFERSRGQMISANNMFIERVTSATESIARMGRGFAMLGLLGKENSEQLLRGLIKIQAVFDLVSGGILTYHRLTRAVEAYHAAVSAAATAEGVLAAARARSAVTGIAAAAGVGGRVAAGGLTATGIASAIGAVLTNPLTALAAAVGSIAFIANAGGSRTWATGKMARGGWFDPGTMGGTALAFGYTGEYSETKQRLAGQGARLGRMAGVIPMREAAEKREQIDMAAADRLGKLRMDNRQRLLETNPRFAGMSDTDRERGMLLAKHRTLTGSLSESRGKLATGGMSYAARIAEEEKIVDYSEKLMDNAKERMAVERRISREKQDSAKESIKSIQHEIELRQQEASEVRKSLLSAAERFGQLDATKQAQIIKAKQKADREGALSLTAGERELLFDVGTIGAKEIASKGALAAGDRAGFSLNFGKEEREAINKAERAQRQMAVTIEDKRKLEVTIKRDTEELAKKLNAMIRKTMIEQEATLIRLLENDRNDQKTRYEIDRALQARAG